MLLHIFPSFSFGGQQARLATLARALGPDYHHEIVALDGETNASALFDDTVSVSFSAIAMKKTRGFDVGNILRLRRKIREMSPDLLCTYNWGAIEAVIANRMGRLAPHIHFEDGFGLGESLEKQKRRRVLARRILLRDARVVVPSNGLEALARDQWKLRNVTRLSNGVDFDLFQVEQRKPPSSVVVGSIGALRPEKNYARLIIAFQTADRQKQAALEIFGDGPARAQLALMGSGDERILLPGHTSTSAQAYARFDIFALSSDTEQAPMTVLEAMAAGLPIVSTNVGDIADMVADDNAPYITPLGDDEAYGHALAQLLQNPSARAAIGAANKVKVREAFTLSHMAEAHRTLYLATMSAHD
ncbi:MAG: glycosyltransferase [Pseudomonadota bacterium]